MRRSQLSPLRLGSIKEALEYERYGSINLNLGAEPPDSILKRALDSDNESHASLDEWEKSGIAVHTDVPMRQRTWRSASFSQRERRGRSLIREAVDRDCGIWYVVSVIHNVLVHS
jgi:hypothetical protein